MRNETVRGYSSKMALTIGVKLGRLDLRATNSLQVQKNLFDHPHVMMGFPGQHHMSFTWKEIASLLGVSRMTLYRKKMEFNMTDVRTPIHSDRDLKALVS